MYNKVLRVDAVKISLKEVSSLLSKTGSLAQWQLTHSNTQLTREHTFKTFEQTWGFLTQVSMRAHLLGHHPTIRTSYNKVKIDLTTHDIISEADRQSSAISDIDIKFAKRIEKYLDLYSSK